MDNRSMAVLCLRRQETRLVEKTDELKKKEVQTILMHSDAVPKTIDRQASFPDQGPGAKWMGREENASHECAQSCEGAEGCRRHTNEEGIAYGGKPSRYYGCCMASTQQQQPPEPCGPNALQEADTTPPLSSAWLGLHRPLERRKETYVGVIYAWAAQVNHRRLLIRRTNG